jgi:riboflavin synthase
MTVTELIDAENFSVDVMPESEKRTMFGLLETDELVNLELPATPETFLSGHIVQGHVDDVGEIVSIKDAGISKIVTIDMPSELKKYIVEKGSITINGVSLTVIHVDDTSFRVGIIPFTWEHTMLYTIEAGIKVNIETDVFARYVENMLHKEDI